MCGAQGEEGRAKEGGERVLSSLVGAFGVPCSVRPRRLPLSQAYPGGRLSVGAVFPECRTIPGDTRGGDGCCHHPLDVALRVPPGGPERAARRSSV